MGKNRENNLTKPQSAGGKAANTAIPPGSNSNNAHSSRQPSKSPTKGQTVKQVTLP
jgi:hypothetical protein